MTGIQLPSDPWLKIFSFLSAKEILRIGSTCHYLLKLSRIQSIWEGFLFDCELFPSLFNIPEETSLLFKDCKITIGSPLKTLLSLYKAEYLLHCISNITKRVTNPSPPKYEHNPFLSWLLLKSSNSPPGDIQSSPGDIQLSPGDIQPSPGDIQPSPGDIQSTPGDIQPSPGDIQPSPGDIQPSPGDTQVTEKQTPFLTNLKLQPIARSSVDYASQDIIHTVDNDYGFWSATGSWDPNSIEYLIYQLPHKFSLVLGLHIHLYSTNGFMGLIVSTGISENNYSFHSVFYPKNVPNDTLDLAVFPFLAIGNFMKITMTGPHSIDVGNSYMMAIYEVRAWGVTLDMELTPDETNQLTELLRNNDPGLNDIVGRYIEHQNVTKLSKEIVTYVTTIKSEEQTRVFLPRWSFYVGERDTLLSEGNVNVDEEQSPFLGQKNERLFKDMVVRKTRFVLYPDWDLFSKSEFFSSVKYLQILDLSTKIGLAGKILPESLFSLVSLQILNLIDAKLDVLPAGIGNLTNLVTLNLIGNQLRSLPPEIGNLLALKQLFIGEGVQHHKREVQHTLGALPAQLGNLVSLEQLWLANSGVTYIPPELGNLTRLTCLLLHNNEGLEIPSTINNLKELKYFTFFVGGSQRTYSYTPQFPISNNQ